MGVVLVALSFVLLSACGDWNRGEGTRVISGHVVRVLEVGDRNPGQTGLRQPFQRLEVQLDESLHRGEVVELQWGGRRALSSNGFLQPGDGVLLELTEEGARTYTIAEVVRLPTLMPIAIALVAALLAVARLKGIAALAGLASSVAVFLLAIVPAVERGDDPLVATIVGSIAVVTISVFVVHGFNRKSLAALLGTLGSLVVVTTAAVVAVASARMSGFGTEDQIFLAVGTEGRVHMPHLVLAGVIVGSLGALVDMSVGQASATSELAAVDRRLRGVALYNAALNVGRDHIGSLVNTLALAYFGGALPLVLLLSLRFQPLSLALNSEEIIESLIAVMVASLGLVLAVPITTGIAVALAAKPDSQ